MRTLFVFAIHVTNRPCKPRHMAKSSSGSSLYAFSALGRTYAPGSSFWAFSTNGRTYSQKQPQEAYFDNFRPLAAQVAKSSSRKLLTSNTAREICVKLNTTWEIVLKLNTTWEIALAPKINEDEINNTPQPSNTWVLLSRLKVLFRLSVSTTRYYSEKKSI